MKYFRSRNSATSTRPYYTVDEVEDMCSSELQRSGCLLLEPGPIRIERFIEKRFGVTPEYADIGDDILGFSRFGLRGVNAIIVSKKFGEVDTVSSERRLRTTLAHEAGHCLLHAHLFSGGETPQDLFGHEMDEPKILCREVTGISAAPSNQYRGNWWEYQANMAIGSLLLPRQLLLKAIEPNLENRGLLGLPALSAAGRKLAEGQLAHIFDVNPIVVRIRLEQLFPVKDDAQLSL